MASLIAIQRSHPNISLKANVFPTAVLLLLLFVSHHVVSASSPHAATAPGVDGEGAGVFTMGAGAVGLKEDVRAGLRDVDLPQNLNGGGSAPETPPSTAAPPLPCVPSSMCLPNSATQSIASRGQPPADTLRRRRFFTPAHWSEHNAREFRLINNIQLLREQLVERLRGAIGEEQWAKTEMKVVPIARRKAENFTFEDFYTNFASKGLPVVIENANFSRVPFTLDFWTRTCGDKWVRPTVMAPNSTGGWGQLIKLPNIKLSEFVERVMKIGAKNESTESGNATKGFNAEDPTWGGKKLHAGARPYVFDWSLPHYCPEAVKEFIVPKYFAQDFFQNLDPKMYDHVNVQNFRESWPSLFIGPKGAQSAMHIDSAGTSFWMGMMSGKKHWRIFPHSRHMLYEEEGWTFAVDALKPDYDKFPLLRMAVAYDAFITEGDAIYVPGGSPHKVVTLEDGVSLSMNFFDHAVRVPAMQVNMDSGDFPALMLRALLDHPELPAEPELHGRGNEDQPWDSYKKPPVMVNRDSNSSLSILLDDREDAVAAWDAMARGDRFLILWAQDAWVANIVLPSLWRLVKGWREGASKVFPLSYVGKEALQIRRLIPPVSPWWAWAMRMAEHHDQPNTDSSYWVYVKNGCMNMTIMPWENPEEELGAFMKDTDAMIAQGRCFPVHTSKNHMGLWRYVTYFRVVSMISDLTGADVHEAINSLKTEIYELLGMFTGESCSLETKVAFAMSLCIAAVLHIALRAAWRQRKNLRASKKTKGKVE